MSRPATTQRASRAGALDLARGHPSDDLLPLADVRAAAAGRLAGDDASMLQYGAERGDDGFRELLAAFLERATGVRHEPSRLLVTSGASQALDLLCTLWTRPGDVVLVERPSYHLALAVFADHGLEVVSVEGDADGLKPEALAAALADDATRRRARMVYLVPAFGNPSGATLAPARREAIVELARRHGLWLVADEVYRLLDFGGRPPAGLAETGPDVVATLQSFSKTLAPGLRLGWMEGPPALLARVEGSGLLQSGGGLAPFVASLVGELLERGDADRHLRRLRGVYGERASALAGALREELPDLELRDATGGYFLWARLRGVDTEAALAACERAGVSYAPGARFLAGGGADDHLRLSFAHYPSDALREAARRLAPVLRDARGLQSGRGSVPPAAR